MRRATLVTVTIQEGKKMNLFRIFKTFMLAKVERNLKLLEEESTRMRVSSTKPHSYETIV